MSYRETRISQHAERLREGVSDGDPTAVAMFAEYLAENGSLGHAVTEIAADMTVTQLVERYVSDNTGQLELIAWARQEAEDQQVETEVYSAA